MILIDENKKRAIRAMIEPGTKVGRLTVLSLDCGSYSYDRKYLCQCECGNTKIVSEDNLKREHTKSCGCLIVEAARQRKTDSVYSKSSKLYRKWTCMRERCRNPKSQNYANYGGRGVRVCDEWQDYLVFEKWAIQNGYNENHKRGEMTIDRIDVNGDYCPENCRLASAKTQANNTRKNRFLEMDGKRKTLSQWAETFGIPYDLMWNRINRGWSIEKIAEKEGYVCLS